jgi:hypothetical protein
MVASVPEGGQRVQHFLAFNRGDYGFTEYSRSLIGTVVSHTTSGSKRGPKAGGFVRRQ